MQHKQENKKHKTSTERPLGHKGIDERKTLNQSYRNI
jgi:hypothetical protein